MTVPALCAAIERAFSVDGAILRPSRRRLSNMLFLNELINIIK